MDGLTCYWGGWCDCSGEMIEDCNNRCPNDPDYIGDQGIYGFDACGICGGYGAIYGNSGDCCIDEIDVCNVCFGDNNTGYADPDGFEHDGSIYCDCEANILDCTGQCGGDLIGTGAYECIGGDYYNKIDCEANGYLWDRIGNDCSGTCQGIDFSCMACPTDDDDIFGDFGSCETAVDIFECYEEFGESGIIISEACPESCGAPCIEDSQGIFCHEEEIDICGYCYGPGIGEGYCDCFNNIINCSGDCPFIYSGMPGIWSTNPDYVANAATDLDSDFICDDVDDCISSGAQHLIFTADGSIAEMYSQVCLDVCIGNDEGTVGSTQYLCENYNGTWYDENHGLTEEQCGDYYGDYFSATPNTYNGGYDLCGVCNGDGFCGFEVTGGVQVIDLTWNKPFQVPVLDRISEDAEIGNNNYRPSTTNREEFCSEPPDSMPDDTTVVEYGLFSGITPSVSLQIENVDFDEGTADIYMSNVPSCSYCDDPLYNFNNISASEMKNNCLSFGNLGYGANWIIDTAMSEPECANVESLNGDGGWWFDGGIAGVQFWISGMTITGISGGNADEYYDLLMYDSSHNCNCQDFDSCNNGESQEGCNMIIGVSITGDYIPAGINQLLMTLEFDNFIGSGICFDRLIGNPYGSLLSSSAGQEVEVDWGSCACSDSHPSDGCGVCGGNGAMQMCGCGLEGNCELVEGACDCTGRLPSAYNNSDGSFICWDEAEVCDISECSPDPAGISYNVYRKNSIGDLVQIANEISYNNYTDMDPGWQEEYCYTVSYLYDENGNGSFDNNEEYYVTLSNEPLQLCATTDAKITGCTDSAACNYDENANHSDLMSCWWSSLGCQCDDGFGALLDACGECGGDNSSCADCAGVPNGGLTDEGCGCGEPGPSGCDNACGSTAVADCAGTCGGSAVADCAGDCDGNSEVDNCDKCDNDSSNDCVQDCMEVWGGTSTKETFYFDGDGDGLGVGSGVSICNGLDLTSWVINNDDTDDNCFSNVHDCSGVCDGTAIEDYCGECSGSNTCIPILISQTSFPDSIISLHTVSMDLVFSHALADYSASGVNIESVLGYPITAVSTVKSDTISIALSILTSKDQLNITLDASKIESIDGYNLDSNSFEDDPGSEADDLSWTYYTETLGDYNHDDIIDIADIDTLILYWGKDDRYELGPCIDGACDGENVPNLTPAFDGAWDIEDLINFVMMYNWSPNTVLSRRSIIEIGKPPIMDMGNNMLTMILPDYDTEIHHIWFQASIPSGGFAFNPSDFNDQFDMVLKRDFEKEIAGEWSLIDMGEGIVEKEIILGSFQAYSRELQSLEFQYKITSGGVVLSSGSKELEYVPVPDKFELSHAYPNPFNPATTVKYGLPVDAEIALSVYDIEGRLVNLLENGYKTAGYHSVVWNASSNASGIYFLHMTAGRYIKTQKLMLVK